MASTVEIIIKTVDESTKQTNKIGGGLKNLLSTVGKMTAGLAAFGFAAKKAFDFGKAGAEIEFTAIKFDRLAASIGTTGDALRTKLADATGGLLSKTDQMSLATDLMSLGLAKTSDEAVRLSKVSSQLGMNMNQLVLTLTNQTTMRFDALGIAVDGFDEKVKTLKESGMSANDAFKEAFLQQAEAQLERVGSVADTTAGQYMQLEAAVKDASSTLKQEWSKAIAPLVIGLADLIKLQNDYNDTYKEYNDLVDKGLIVEKDANRVRENTVEVQHQIDQGLTLWTESEAMGTEEMKKHIQVAKEQQAIYEGLLPPTEALGDELLTGVKVAIAETTDEMESEIKTMDELTDAFNSLWGASQKDWAKAFEDFAKGAEFLAGGGRQFIDFNTNVETLGAKLAGAGDEAVDHFLPKIQEATDKSKIAFWKMQQDLGEMDFKTVRENLQGMGMSYGEAVALARDDTYDWQSELTEANGLVLSIIAALDRLDGTKVAADVVVKYNYQGYGGSSQPMGSGGPANNYGIDNPNLGQAKGGPLRNIALVGEQGPELVINGVVIPAAETKKLMHLGLNPAQQFVMGGALEGEYIHPVTGNTFYPLGGGPTTSTSGGGGGGGGLSSPSADVQSEQKKQSVQLAAIQYQTQVTFNTVTSKTANEIKASNETVTSRLDELINKVVDEDGVKRAFTAAMRTNG